MESSSKVLASSVPLPEIPSISQLSQQSAVRECLQWFVKEKQWITEQQIQLCRVAAPTFLEARRAEWMVSVFRELGCEANIDRAGNVIAHLQANSHPPYVALTAHLDTVLAPRTPDEIHVDPDGTLRGPGVSDNGAGLAALLAIAKVLKTCGNQEFGSVSVVFIANVGEEGEGNLSGMRYLCRQSPLAEKIRSFVVLDGPTTDHITCQALASRRFEISFTGAGGHSWSDFGAGNPVHALSRAMVWFLEGASAINLSALPRVSYNFGMVEGGSSINSIPASARAKLDVRSESTNRIDALVEVLTISIDRALQSENGKATGSRVTAKLKEIGSRPGGQIPSDSYLLRALRLVDAHLAIRSAPDCASTDANIPLSLNMPAVSIGAGGQGGGAHTASEWFHPDGRETGLRRILLTLLLLLAES